MKKYLTFLFLLFLIVIFNKFVFSAQSGTFYREINATNFTFGDNGENKGFKLTEHNPSHHADNKPIHTDQGEVEAAFGNYIKVNYYNKLITSSFDYVVEDITNHWNGIVLKAVNLSNDSIYWTAGEPGDDEVLYIDPELGRFRVISTQAFNTTHLTVNYYYDIIPPSNPKYKDLPDEFINDTPYDLHGTKEPYSAIWLSLNNGEWEEVVSADDKDVWSYQIYFSEGNNVMHIYAKDQVGNQSEIVESIPINYFAYLSKDIRIIDASKGWFTFGVRDENIINEQIGHRLVKNDLAKTPLGLNPAEMEADIIEAYNNNWLKVKFINEDIVSKFNMTIKYIDLLNWNSPSPAVGNNELGIDPINGRLIIGPGDALTAIKPEAFNLSSIHYYDPVPPAPPEIINIPEDFSDFTADCPFLVKGVKTPYCSVWFRLNETEEFKEISPVDTILEWEYSDKVYLKQGRNIIEVYSEDYSKNKSCGEDFSYVTKYILYYKIIKPSIEQDIFATDQCYITLQGLKGKNSGIEYTTNINNPYQNIIEINEDLNWSYLFSLKKRTNNFYIRTVDLGDNHSEPVSAKVVYSYQDPTLEVYSPTTSSSQWISGSIGKKTPIDDSHIKISCDNGIIVGSVIPVYDDYHFVCKLKGFNNIGIPYNVDLYTIDEVGNESAYVNKKIIFDPDSVGEEDISYQWDNNKLKILWTSPPGANNYQIYLSRKKAEFKTENLSLYSSISQTNKDYIRKLDSPYLCFHIKPDTSDNFTHKQINAKQLTTLTPFYEAFKRKEVLNQGTFFQIKEWSVNEPSRHLQNNQESDTSMIYIPQISPTWSSYEYEVRLKKTDGANTDISLLYRLKSQDKFYEFNIKNNQLAHIYNSQNIINLITETVDLSEYKRIKLVVKYHKASGNTYVKSFIENGDGDMELKNYFVYPVFPYGGVGLKVKDCRVNVDYIKVTPIN